MRCVDAAPQLTQLDDGGDDMSSAMVAATPSNNIDNTILTYTRRQSTCK